MSPDAFIGAPIMSSYASWKPTVFFKSTSHCDFDVSRWTIRLWCKRFGIAHHWGAARIVETPG